MTDRIMAATGRERVRLNDAQSALAGSYFLLAISLARRFRPGDNRDRDDLESAACWGLMRAAELWESPRKVDFSRLARFWITSALFDAFKRRRPLGYIHPRHGRPPAIGPLPDGGMADLRADPPGVGMERAEEVARTLARMPPDGAAICRAVYLDGRSYADVAVELGMTADAIAARRDRAIRGLIENAPARDARDAARDRRLRSAARKAIARAAGRGDRPFAARRAAIAAQAERHRDRLTPIQARVLSAIYRDGKPYGRVAVELGITPNAVRHACGYAKAKLRASA